MRQVASGKRTKDKEYTFRLLDYGLRDCVIILVCHCGEPKPRAQRVGAQQCVWQSLYYQRLMGLLRSLYSLAKTLRYSLIRQND